MDIDWAHVKQAFTKREEIKQQIRDLQALDREICEWLDQELFINKYSPDRQEFDGPGFKVVAKVPQNYKADEEALDHILSGNKELQPYADIFQYKLEVLEGKLKKAPAEVQRAFAPAISISPGKTSYEIKETNDETEY